MKSTKEVMIFVDEFKNWLSFCPCLFFLFLASRKLKSLETLAGISIKFISFGISHSNFKLLNRFYVVSARV